MTNIEYYGLKNLIFKQHSMEDRMNGLSYQNWMEIIISYNAAHSHDPIQLRLLYVNDTPEEIRDAKVKWLLEEHKHVDLFSDAKHARRCSLCQ